MAENCTVYCQSKELATVTRLIRDEFPDLSHDGDDASWTTLNAASLAGSMRLTVKLFRERGDEFCRLLLSTCVFIDRQSEVPDAARKKATRHVETCAAVIGVVVEPGFDADERFEKLVFAIATELDGIVFTGSAFLNATGETIVGIS